MLRCKCRVKNIINSNENDREDNNNVGSNENDDNNKDSSSELESRKKTVVFISILVYIDRFLIIFFSSTSNSLNQ